MSPVSLLGESLWEEIFGARFGTTESAPTTTFPDTHIGGGRNGRSSDVDVLRHSLLVADESPSPAAIAELVDVLMFVRGLPFSGRSYAWAAAEGITSTVVWLVTRAIELAVEVAKSHGDDATVLDATAAGLRMLPNDEYFLGLQRSAMGSRLIDDGRVAPSPSQSPVASTR